MTYARPPSFSATVMPQTSTTIAAGTEHATTLTNDSVVDALGSNGNGQPMRPRN